MFAKMNLFLWQNLDTNSDRLFSSIFSYDFQLLVMDKSQLLKQNLYGHSNIPLNLVLKLFITLFPVVFRKFNISWIPFVPQQFGMVVEPSVEFSIWCSMILCLPLHNLVCFFQSVKTLELCCCIKLCNLAIEL